MHLYSIHVCDLLLVKFIKGLHFGIVYPLKLTNIRHLLTYFIDINSLNKSNLHPEFIGH